MTVIVDVTNLVKLLERILHIRNQFSFISVNRKNDFFIEFEQNLRKLFQLTFTCSNSTIETLEKGVKYVQS